MTTRPEPLGDLDWGPERARAFTDRVAGLYEEYLARLRELPVTRGRRAAEVHDAVALEVPEEPMPDEELFAHLREVAFEQATYPGHPRFMAYVSGAGTVPGAAADLLAAGLNMNAGGWILSPPATEIEHHLTRTFASWFGLPAGAGGIVVSGGAMANFIALKAGRDRGAGWDVRREGVAAGPPLAMYLSQETHVVSARAADMLGLGTDAVRVVGVGADARLRVDELRAAIARDRGAGGRPFAVVA
ncbi:MAG: pyridoxal phosphate-dependent decarboxylase family protein, partial [Actinomycetota bacterium]